MIAFALRTLLIAALRTLLIHGRVNGTLLVTALQRLLILLNRRNFRRLLLGLLNFHFRLGLGCVFLMYHNRRFLLGGRLLLHHNRFLRFLHGRISGLLNRLCFCLFHALFVRRSLWLLLFGRLSLFFFRSIFKNAVIPADVNGKVAIRRKHLH